jgi:hypothetical protein
MLRFLEIKYLVVVVVASLVAIVYLQVTGAGPALQANAPLARYWAQLRLRDDGREAVPVRQSILYALAGRRLRR